MAEAFDYIVVGAGSAGCVLANRLTADGRSTVLLLEAGPRDTDPWIHIPLGYGKLFTKPDVNWAYESEPEPALNGRRIFTPRGKVLGGSSSINGLVYIRGQPEDFDDWEMPGWSLRRTAAVLQEVRGPEPGRAATRCTARAARSAVSDLTSRHELCDAFIEAAAQRSAFRATTTSTASARRARATTRPPRATAGARAPRSGYLRPAEKRPNLKVETERARVEEYCSRARERSALSTSQEAKADPRQKQTARSSSAAGAINSPQLLQLSGRRLRARCCASTASRWCTTRPSVGEHLQDHL